MAKVTPTIPGALPCSSLNTPANLTNRGTGNVGTDSGATCAVRPGACGSADTGGRCACAPATHSKNTKHNKDHLAVRFMGPLLSSQAKGIKILSGSGPRLGAYLSGDNPKKLGDGPRDWPGLYPPR